LKHFSGVLQADAYAGYNAIYKGGRVIEAGCWSHARRKLWDIHVKQQRLPGTLAHQGLVRMGELFKVEADVNGRSALRRRRMRQTRTVPVLTELKSWMSETLAQVPAKSPMALAIGYSLSNWTAPTKFVDDGRIDAHNNAAERALRGVAMACS
jgi:transposase